MQSIKSFYLSAMGFSCCVDCFVWKFFRRRKLIRFDQSFRESSHSCIFTPRRCCQKSQIHNVRILCKTIRKSELRDKVIIWMLFNAYAYSFLILFISVSQFLGVITVTVVGLLPSFMLPSNNLKPICKLD